VVARIKPRSRERGGRTPPQKRGNRCKLPTIPDRAVCPSGSRFRSIAKDLGSLREMPSFALSRRQRGFESRWGHKIKPPLTRPDTTASRSASPRIHRQGRARDAAALASAPSAGAPDQPILLGHIWVRGCRRTCAVASLDLVRDANALWRIAEDYQRVGDHPARVIRLRDAGRRQDPAMAGDFPPFTFQPQPGGKK
jgi:hypothetical protein